ncbi:hypothetical protein, partial [Erwinia mallotivora]|uniref:hypothetical protein n=1 Tax=Erwinia mallotivora TaxID=69222 RepID=UPI0021C127C1
EAGYMFVTTLSEKDPPVLASGRCPYMLFSRELSELFTFNHRVHHPVTVTGIRTGERSNIKNVIHR